MDNAGVIAARRRACGSWRPALYALLTMADKSAKPNVARRSHHWQDTSRRVTPISRRYNTAASNLAAALEIQFDQQLVETFQVAGKCVSRRTIRSWRDGSRKPPHWAYQILADMCRARIIMLEDAIKNVESELTKEKAGD